MIEPPEESARDEQRVFEHDRTAAEDIAIPIVAQDHPASSRVHMSVRLILRLVEVIPRIGCVKEEAPRTAT